MRTALVLLLFAFNTYGQQTTPDLKKMDWLPGTWNQTNVSKPGRTSIEYWEKYNQNELRGRAVTLQGTDTLFVEKATILVKDNDIFYLADVPGNKAPVYFKFTEFTDKGFICENPEHDFPKKISYQFDGKKLAAQISGNGKVIDYFYEKVE